jgi:hypothetical protein
MAIYGAGAGQQLLAAAIRKSTLQRRFCGRLR